MLLGRGVRGADRLLSEESIDEMASDQLEGLVVTEQPGVLPNISEAFPLGAGRDVFGLGFQITVGDRPGERSSGSLSWSGIQNTHFWVDVQRGLGVILMTQVAPFYEEGVLELISAFEHALYEGAR
jgi:CubicO group peptidase (beta-lactamase class C family)